MFKAFFIISAYIFCIYIILCSSQSEEEEELDDVDETFKKFKRYWLIIPPSNLTGWTPRVVTLGEFLFGRRPYVIG